VGYRGKVEHQERARVLRAEGLTLVDIATELGVAKSSVSLWVRDVPFEPRTRRQSIARRPHPQHLAKLAEIEECDRLGLERIGRLSDDAFLAAGTALYAGEGAKRDGKVTFANTNPMMMAFFCAWLRLCRRRGALASPCLPARRARPRGRRAVLVIGDRRAANAVHPRVPREGRPVDPLDRARERLWLRGLSLFANAPRSHGPGAGAAIL
jgi:transcriptional regulator with XRE-family HTH domain